MPSAFSIILFFKIQAYPLSIAKMPSARDLVISLFIIIVSQAFAPPYAILALKFFDKMFFSM
jgi:hypothetical protein